MIVSLHMPAPSSWALFAVAVRHAPLLDERQHGYSRSLPQTPPVRAVRLGQGGFILTVAAADDSVPGPERQVTLTTSAVVRKLGQARVL